MLQFPFETQLVSSRYGFRQFGGSNQSWHSGIDFAVAGNRGVTAAENGVVTKVEYTNLRGYQLEIQHDPNTRTRYHMLRSDLASTSTEGDQVYKGQIVGHIAGVKYSANSAWTGPHLHFEVLRKNSNGTFSTVDPIEFITKQPNYDFAGSGAVKLEEEYMPTVAEIWNTAVINNPTQPGQVMTAAQFMSWSLTYSATTDAAVRGVDQIDGATKTVGSMVGHLTAGVRDARNESTAAKSEAIAAKNAAAALPDAVWNYPLPHTVTKNAQGAPALTAAKEFLRYEPLEHKQTRDKIG